jgi:hypothetical protein
MEHLRAASLKSSAKTFKSVVFSDPDSNAFTEVWAARIYSYLYSALGPFGTEPLSTILPMPSGMHMSGATASFDMQSGQMTLCPSVEGNQGQILEKITHEMVHGSYSQFPSNDEFYDEGFVDYSTWLLAHGPIYMDYRQQVIDSAAYNIKMRRERAMKNLSDYDRKRWAGGVFANVCLGPMLLHRMRMKKAEGDFTW